MDFNPLDLKDKQRNLWEEIIRVAEGEKIIAVIIGFPFNDPLVILICIIFK